MLQQHSEFTAMPVNQMVDLLSMSYLSVIRSGKPFINFPSVMLWGPPGVGKSQGIRQVAKEIAQNTGKRVAITDVRLLLFNPVDLRGIPTANEDRTLAVWLRPKIFQMDESEDVINILFLDEISAAPQSVQASAYQITLDRTVGEHKLPENCIVIAAGNRVTDRSVAYTMPKALANRMCHIEISVDSDSWLKWARQAGIHPIVKGFIGSYPEKLLDFNAQESGLAFPTPRSWEMVSNILNTVSSDIKRVLPLIIGCVGGAAAYDLLEYSIVYGTMPDVEEIFAGRIVGVPTRPEVLFALVAAIVEHAEGRNKTEVGYLVEYAFRIPVDFRDRLFYDILQIKTIRKFLAADTTYDDWFARKGLDWEDYNL